MSKTRGSCWRLTVSGWCNCPLERRSFGLRDRTRKREGAEGKHTCLRRACIVPASYLARNVCSNLVALLPWTAHWDGHRDWDWDWPCLPPDATSSLTLDLKRDCICRETLLALLTGQWDAVIFRVPSLSCRVNAFSHRIASHRIASHHPAPAQAQPVNALAASPSLPHPRLPRTQPFADFANHERTQGWRVGQAASELPRSRNHPFAGIQNPLEPDLRPFQRGKGCVQVPSRQHLLASARFLSPHHPPSLP